MFVDNIAHFLQLNGFGVSATVDGQTVVGIFDREYNQAFDGMASNHTTFVCRSTDVASATQASVLAYDGHTYRIRSVQPDGTGATVLLLELTA